MTSITNKQIDQRDLVYLRPNVKLELLTGRWYTWPHLLSPIQYALNLAFRQIPMIEAYLADPQSHANIMNDSDLKSAPILHVDTENADYLTSLLTRLQQDCSPAIRFANDISNLDRAIVGQRTAGSLEHIYATLPDSLRGLVEVTRDHCNQPALRIYEELMFGDCVDSAPQQEISLTTLPDKERPFFLNTPRLLDTARFDIRIPFRDSRYDMLITSRRHPVSFECLCNTLNINHISRNHFREFFTHKPPIRRAEPPCNSSFRLRYFGHACVLLETPDISILVDPMTTWDPHNEDGHLKFDDFPDRIDYVFITHNHHDHFVPELLWQLRDRIGTVLVPINNLGGLADPSMRLALNSLGIVNVEVMSPMQKVVFKGGELMSLPFLGEHAEMSIYAKHALHVNLLGHSLLFLADSRCVDRIVYRRIAKRIGSINTVFLGMECDGAPLTWLYGPYLTSVVTRSEDRSRRLSGSNATQASALIEELNPARVYVYAMAMEPWLSYLAGLSYKPGSPQLVESDKLIEWCAGRGIQARRLNGCEELIVN